MERTLPKGHLSLLSRAFRYTPSTSTNLAQTFARVRHRLQAAAPAPRQHAPLPWHKAEL